MIKISSFFIVDHSRPGAGNLTEQRAIWVTWTRSAGHTFQVCRLGSDGYTMHPLAEANEFHSRSQAGCCWMFLGASRGILTSVTPGAVAALPSAHCLAAYLLLWDSLRYLSVCPSVSGVIVSISWSSSLKPVPHKYIYCVKHIANMRLACLVRQGYSYVSKCMP